MKITSEQLGALIDKHADSAWTESDFDAEVKEFEDLYLTYNDTKLNGPQLSSIRKLLVLAGTQTTKNSLSATISLLTELGLIEIHD